MTVVPGQIVHEVDQHAARYRRADAQHDVATSMEVIERFTRVA